MIKILLVSLTALFLISCSKKETKSFKAQETIIALLESKLETLKKKKDPTKKDLQEISALEKNILEKTIVLKIKKLEGDEEFTSLKNDFKKIISEQLSSNISMSKDLESRDKEYFKNELSELDNKRKKLEVKLKRLEENISLEELKQLL